MLKKIEFSSRFVITLGVFITLIGFGLLSNNYFQSKVLIAYDDMNLQILALNNNEQDSEVVENNENNVTDDQQEEVKPQVTKPNIKYVASLSIPKISLKHGLTSINSKYNSVNYGIQVIKESDYPNVSKGNLILAGHSGTSKVSFFKNLYKLSLGDICEVTYKGKTYKYKIKNIYNVPKTGRITIDRDYTKTTLTLITCTKDSKKLQTIYICELI